MKKPTRSRLPALAAALAATGLLAACGGGDDPAPTPTTSVSGSVVKGPVSGASVCAYKAAAGGKGEQIKCTTTNTTGGYSLDLSYDGDVVIEATGGTYTDEATGASKTLGDAMQVVLAAHGGSATGVVTPLTTIAYNIARAGSGGLSSASFATAAGTVATQFQLPSSVNIAGAVPVVSGTAIDAYGKLLRAVSQYLANGNSLATLMAFNNPTSIQSAFSAAYATINGTTLTVNFGGTTGGGTGGGTGGTTGNKTLTVSVTVSGVTTTAATITNVPAPATQADFCSAVQGDATFTQIGAGAGGSLTINSCSFSGGTGTIDATLKITSPVAITVPYTIVYRYQ